jgi:hypothetical protein
MDATQRCKAVYLATAFILLTLCASAQVARSGVAEATQRDATSVAAASWNKLDAGPFSILAPTGWKFHQLTGVDSDVGEFVGDGMALTFDFGRYSTELRNAKKPAYTLTKESIGGLSARVVSPRIAGNGITGVYFRKIPGHDELCLWGRNLTAAQQKLALEIFETIQFGGPMPPSIVPPPQPQVDVKSLYYTHRPAQDYPALTPASSPPKMALQIQPLLIPRLRCLPARRTVPAICFT